MKSTNDLSQLEWTLTGWLPYLWRLGQPVEVNSSQAAEVGAISAKVTGSVQQALLDAGLIKDWNVGLNYRECQWVENLHWVYEAKIPDAWLENGTSMRLECLGLDGSGWIRLNGEDIAEFSSSHKPHVFDLTGRLKPTGNLLHIIFACPPRWCGQFGFTSQMTDWKVRFNYTWDWTARLVQTGIWDGISLVATDGTEIEEFRVVTGVEEDGAYLRAWGKIAGPENCRVSLKLSDGGTVICEETAPASRFNAVGVTLSDLAVERWWPNGHGTQPLYTLEVELLDVAGIVVDTQRRRVGFRDVSWQPCTGALPEADPWICTVNGKPIFLQGANWTPIRPNFADVTDAQYRHWLTLYRDLGFNILRVWGGAMLEKEIFYELCDELGLMVWQEFPLSSSGCDNYPPEDEDFIREMAVVAESYIVRRQYHTSLVIWCGGNELYTRDERRGPVDVWHPMIHMLQEIAQREDPSRRFLVASPSGPTPHAHMPRYGEGVHWDVHGPWTTGAMGMADKSLAAWQAYWDKDDALLRSETGNPGASPADIIRKYAGDYPVEPATAENPLWRRPTVWWVDYHLVTEDHGREPADFEEYVAWSQQRQATALTIAVQACKGRFPACGGIIFWMGHDCFPCTANTAIIDFEGRPKPAALAVAELFKEGSKV